MNEEMPWVNLTQSEVNELRNKKQELTEYGKQRLKELMNNQEPYPDAMFEEAARREAENKALATLDELYKKHGDAMLRLAEIEKEEWERRERADTVLARYNRFYNDECSGMPHGTPITPEHMQAVTLECMIDALRCENMNVEYNSIAIDDIKDLIEALYQQGRDYLERVRKLKGESND